ncbi:hypothetical protein L1787_18390 [Acuticoccus sp. M5D2P5]|uniref:hypothetical protein n=1 Tax=Acuticoccus kalidii TaxID=2910977 RepID=UPI001F3EDFF3|nr:hypothetical protein [Acuticoccus kalidii]MCF3935367.1 hypothetical protein [Acuticoccus kalidii]
MPDSIRSIVERFPERELELYRRCARDARFRAVCADYEEASAALLRWQNVPATGPGRVDEYRHLLAELEVEILAQLERPA